MGADVLYFTPCCHSQDFKEVDGYEIICGDCGHVFTADELVKQVIDYDNQRVD